MTTYKKITVKKRDYAVVGNNKKILPFKNSFNKKILAELLAAATLPIVATNDAITINSTTGATNVINVLTNDTLGASAATISNIILTTASPNANLTLNPNGSIDVKPAALGTYSLAYQICQKDVPTNCKQGVVTVTIEAATLPN